VGVKLNRCQLCFVIRQLRYQMTVDTRLKICGLHKNMHVY